MIARLRIYVLSVAVCSVIWEAAQMPLYTLWRTGSDWEIVADIFKCTGANLIIASASLVCAMLVARAGKLQSGASPATIALTCIMSVGYTIYSERLNVYVKGTWSYSDLMPLVPGLDVGVSPLAQWIVLPSIGILLAKRVDLAEIRPKRPRSLRSMGIRLRRQHHRTRLRLQSSSGSARERSAQTTDAR